MLPPHSTAGISHRRCVQVPELSSGGSTCPQTEYIPGHSTTISSLTMKMDHTQSSESGAPPNTSCPRSQFYTGSPQSRPPVASVFPPPQISYHTPHQSVPGTSRDTHPTLSSIYTVLPHTAPPTPVAQHGSFVSHQHSTPSNAHPYPYMPFAFPLQMGSEAYSPTCVSCSSAGPPMMTTLHPHGPVYQYQTPPGYVSTPAQIISPGTSALTSPIYPLSPGNTSPPHNSSLSMRRPMNRFPTRTLSAPYGTHDAYPSIWYAVPPQYAHPSPTLFTPPIYARYITPHYTQPYGISTGQVSHGTRYPEGTRGLQPGLNVGYPSTGQHGEEQPSERGTVSLPFEPHPTLRQAGSSSVAEPEPMWAQLPTPTTQASSPTV